MQPFVQNMERFCGTLYNRKEPFVRYGTMGHPVPLRRGVHSSVCLSVPSIDSGSDVQLVCC